MPTPPPHVLSEISCPQEKPRLPFWTAALELCMAAFSTQGGPSLLDNWYSVVNLKATLQMVRAAEAPAMSHPVDEGWMELSPLHMKPLLPSTGGYFQDTHTAFAPGSGVSGGRVSLPWGLGRESTVQRYLTVGRRWRCSGASTWTSLISTLAHDFTVCSHPRR